MYPFFLPHSVTDFKYENAQVAFSFEMYLQIKQQSDIRKNTVFSSFMTEKL